MSTFMLKNNSSNFTLVSNVFIEKYMPKARGEFIKVYLLMLKYNNSGEMGANSTILASTLNLLESDILNALNYWNDEGVIKLIPIDKMGNYNIEFIDLVEDSKSRSKEVNLLEALNKTSTKDMLNDIERLLGRPLSPKEMTTYLSWQEEFNFSSELILILIDMYWTLELASKLEDAPWPATKDELIDYAMRSGAPLEVIENLQEMEDEGEIYESIEDIWPDYPSKEDFFFNEEEY